MIQLKTLLQEKREKVTYEGGDTYIGQVSEDGKKHGYGVYTYKSDGSQLKGQWVSNKFTGYGVYITPAGVEWRGKWVDTKLNGKSPGDLDNMKAPVDITPRDKTRFVYPGDKVWIYAYNKNKEWLAAKRGTNKWYNLSVSTNPKMQQAAKDLKAKAEVYIGIPLSINR
jgi:hypothetical protein